MTHKRVVERGVRMREHFAVAPAAGPTLAFLPEGRADIQAANARLIAAAPDMLKLLHAAYHALESYRYGNASPDLAASVAVAIHDVIAKAEGRS